MIIMAAEDIMKVRNKLMMIIQKVSIALSHNSIHMEEEGVFIRHQI